MTAPQKYADSLRIYKDIEPESVEWLWPNRIPDRKLTVAQGDPGVGKTALSYDLAARVTTGRQHPDGSPCPQGSVLIITVEDDPADTIRPRLEAAGANLELVAHVAASKNDKDQPQLISFPENAEYLRQVIKYANVQLPLPVRLVIIDPLNSHIGSNLNAWKGTDVRKALWPLAAIARETGVAILVIHHLNKRDGETNKALYRGQGSIDIAGIARSVLMVGKDPDIDELRVLATVKCNVAKDVPSLSFSLEDAAIPDGNGGVIETVRVKWLGESNHTADSLVSSKMPRDRAKEFLEEVLADEPWPATEVYEEAERRGISESTVKRAKEELGIVARRVGGIGGKGHWEWNLPKQNTGD